MGHCLSPRHLFSARICELSWETSTDPQPSNTRRRLAGSEALYGHQYSVASTRLWRSSYHGNGSPCVRKMKASEPIAKVHRPAVRRKFYELYRISPPSNANTSLSRSDSPSTSPSKTASPVTPINATQLIFPDTFTLVVIELIKLIQSALAIWGLFGADREDLEIDGLFCDETKTAIFQWRRDMGMEHEESMRLEA